MEDDKLQKLTKAIQKAVPEIMELKFGCRILTTRGKELFVSNENIDIIKSFDTEIEILGRPITLEDVLVAMRKKHDRDITIDARGVFLSYEDDEKLDTRNFLQTDFSWQLNKPLHEQSKETIDFLYDLICKT